MFLNILRALGENASYCSTLAAVRKKSTTLESQTVFIEGSFLPAAAAFELWANTHWYVSLLSLFKLVLIFHIQFYYIQSMISRL